MPTQNIYNMVDTWASGGGPYTSIKMNATDNDSGSASLLMDLQVGGVSRFNVSKIGNASLVSPTSDAVFTIKSTYSAGSDADAALVLDASTGGEAEVDFLFQNTQKATVQWRNSTNVLIIEAQASGSAIDLWTGGGSTLLLKSDGSMEQYLPSSLAALSFNGTMGIEFTNNTTLTFKARGSDGVTRSATLTLA